MNWTKTNQILQTTANFGIILGLVLVGVQIRDTNRIASAEFLTQSFDQQIAGLDLIVGDNLGVSWARATSNPSEITDHDLVVIRAYMQRLWYVAGRDRAVTSLGIEGGNYGGTSTIWAERILSVEPALRWWTSQQDLLLAANPELRDEINTKLVNLRGVNAEMETNKIEEMRNSPLFPESVSDKF